MFGDVAVSLFVAGAVFGQIWVDSRGAKCFNFPYKMRLRSAKSTLGEGAGARWRVWVRIMLESAAHCKWRFNCFWQISLRFWSAILRGRCSIWWGWRVVPVSPRIVNDISYVGDLWCESFLVAGAIFGEVRGWLIDVASRIVLGVSCVGLSNGVILGSTEQYFVVHNTRMYKRLFAQTLSAFFHLWLQSMTHPHSAPATFSEG